MSEPKTKLDPLVALAQAIASRARGDAPSRPKLRLIELPKPSLFDSITRESCLKRIRFLRNAYRLQWLVDQAAFDTPGLECLSDEKISGLLDDMERARECIEEGIAFEDAGLVRRVDAPNF